MGNFFNLGRFFYHLIISPWKCVKVLISVLLLSLSNIFFFNFIWKKWHSIDLFCISLIMWLSFKKWLRIQLLKCESRELFYLGQSEDYSLGDNISDISEKLIQRISGGMSVYMWFWWSGSACNQAHIFCRRFILVMRSRCLHKDFSAFLDMRRYKNLCS